MTSPVRKAAIGIFAAAFALAVTGSTIAPVSAADPGVSDTEIVLGGTHPYSGPASAYGNIGKGIAAYFSYVNDKGGVNGRKIKYIDKDDGYSPPQAVQLVHQMVEQDHVFAIFDTLGTAVNTALRPYLNQQGVPHMFVATGASTWGKDANKFPWTIGWQPDYQAEAILYSQDILQNHPKAKIAVLYQNDDYGEDYNAGLKRGLGKHYDMVVKSVSYETSDPSVGSQIATLKASGADTFMIFATPKFAIQAMVLAAQQSWHPTIYLNNVSNAIPYMQAAAKAGGPSAVYGVSIAYTMCDVLRQAGKDLTRKKVMDIASHLNEKDNPWAYPGVSIRTSPSFRYPITQMIAAKWLGTDWSPTGILVDTRSMSMAEK